MRAGQELTKEEMLAKIDGNKDKLDANLKEMKAGLELLEVETLANVETSQDRSQW
jgi:hypothetical protein